MEKIPSKLQMMPKMIVLSECMMVLLIIDVMIQQNLLCCGFHWFAPAQNSEIWLK
jgi:hypothetical protein